MLSNSIRRSPLLLCPPLAALSLAMGGCVPEAQDPDLDVPDQETMSAESRYMGRIFAEKIKNRSIDFIKIDLSDEKQYEFVMHRLLAAGNTRENSPRLFERLSQVQADLRNPTPGAGLGSASSALEAEWCGDFMTLPHGISGTSSTVNATTTVTCFGGADYVFADLAAYETDEAGTYLNGIDYDSGEEYSGGTYFASLAVTSNLPVNVGKFHLADSMALAIDDATGAINAVYATSKVAAANETPTITRSHPIEINGGTPIRACIKRAAWAGVGDCDYAGVTANGFPGGSTTNVGMAKMVNKAGQWQADSAPENRWFPWPGFTEANIYLPISGTFDAGAIGGFKASIKSYDSTFTRATLIRVVEGGWCNGTSNATATGLFSNLDSQPKDMRTAQFNLLADFGKDCLKNLQSVELNVSILAKAKFGADPLLRTRGQTEKVKPLDLRNSCFADGTGILRPDGTYTEVKEIAVGDKVLANESGLTLTVESITRGGELEPLVHLQDSQGHDVLLTEKHPVMTTSGVMAAERVIEGTEVRTEHGVAKVVRITRVPYDRYVYNFDLGTPEELSGLAPQDRTMFAGGIQVGDNRMQAELEKQQLQEKVERELPAAWRKDYDNDQARKAAALGAAK